MCVRLLLIVCMQARRQLKREVLDSNHVAHRRLISHQLHALQRLLKVSAGHCANVLPYRRMLHAWSMIPLGLSSRLQLINQGIKPFNFCILGWNFLLLGIGLLFKQVFKPKDLFLQLCHLIFISKCRLLFLVKLFLKLAILLLYHGVVGFIFVELLE